MSTNSRAAELRAGVAEQAKTSQPWDLPPSFDEFAASASTPLLRSAYLLLGDPDHAEDLVQAALVRVARRWDVARSSPYAYAHRVLVNLVHDRRRTLSRRVREQRLDGVEERSAVAVDEMQARVDRVVVLSAVRRLPARQREVVVLRFFADLSVADTAMAIGITEGTVKAHTSRALVALREALTGESARSITRKGETSC